jgi:IS5 family transposase
MEEHTRLFDRSPRLATADRCYQSASNERYAHDHGVKRVAVPARGKNGEARSKLQKEPWFRRAYKWRGGVESRIVTLKHVFGMARACAFPLRMTWLCSSNRS